MQDKEDNSKKHTNKKCHLKKFLKEICDLHLKYNAGQPQVPGRGRRVSRGGQVMVKLLELGL